MTRSKELERVGANVHYVLQYYCHLLTILTPSQLSMRINYIIYFLIKKKKICNVYCMVSINNRPCLII